MRKAPPLARVQRVQRVGSAPKLQNPDVAKAKEAAVAKAASQRLSRKQSLGASLLEMMEKSGFQPPEEKTMQLPEPPIDRTQSGGEPIEEWKPVLLENEQPPDMVDVAKAEALMKREKELLKYAMERIRELNRKPFELDDMAAKFWKTKERMEKTKTQGPRRRLFLEACDLASEMIRKARYWKTVHERRKKNLAGLQQLIRALLTAPSLEREEQGTASADASAREELTLMRFLFRDRKATIRAEAEAALQPLYEEAFAELRKPLLDLWATVAPYGDLTPPKHSKRPAQDETTKEETQTQAKAAGGVSSATASPSQQSDSDPGNKV